MQRRAVMSYLVILSAFFTGALADVFPSCVKQNVQPNQMQCFNWQYSNDTDTCSFVPAVFLTLFPGMGFGVDFLYQPGRVQSPPMYANNYLCEWNIQPKDACSRISLFMDADKDFHDDGQVATNPSCDCNDHVELNYNGGNNVDRYCGDAMANNCPFSNCIQSQLTSGTHFNLTFRSDESGTAGGFFAVVINDDPVAGCTLKRSASLTAFSSTTVDYNVVQKMEVPRSTLCDYLMTYEATFTSSTKATVATAATAARDAKRSITYQPIPIPCDCYGNCTPVIGYDQVKAIISSIATDTSGSVAYRYVNSWNPVLMRVARRALLNKMLFGTPLPTIQERLEYEQRKYADYCQSVYSPFDAKYAYPDSYKAYWYN